MKILFTIIAAAIINIIPQPQEMTPGDGRFKLEGAKDCKVQFTLDENSGIPAEGYTLKVTKRGVKAVASTPAGLFYARQSLMQMMDADGYVPCVEIKDWPRFSWRGFHQDVSRHFLSIEEIKQELDILAQYKINTFHWHLTDDQGWRIEIKKYPLLTQVGAWRTEYDGSIHGGYYTQDQIREVVAYAAERYITVVPEIEMPGHSIAAIRAYPWLSCTGEYVGSFYTWGTPDMALCAGNDRVFEFLEDVIAEVADLFPCKYIHVGGDECRKNRWEQCPRCQARIKELGLVGDSEFTAEQKLQSYFIRRMEGVLHKYNRSLVGWDEILEGGLSPDATVMSWRGEEGGKKAALAGHDVIMTPSKAGMYLDSYQGDPKAEPLAFGRYTPLETVYSYDPVPQILKDNGKDQFVIGLQGNLWSEYLYSVSQRQYMMFPRIFAIAEIAWTQPERKDYESFCIRVDAACRRLDAIGVNYHIPLPEQVEGSCSNIAFTDKAVLEFKTTRPMEMVYSLNGEDPNLNSPRYTKPLEFTQDAVLKIASVTSYGKMSAVRTINIRKQTPLPAIPEADVVPGIRCRRSDGRYLSVAELMDVEWRPVELERLRDFTKLEPYNRNMPDSTRFFAAVAEGFFKVKETKVYRFATDCDQLWVDGKLLIDNGYNIMRNSRLDSELALEKGAHSFKVVYIYKVLGGWNTLANKTDVLVLPKGGEKWDSMKIIK